MPVTQVEIPVEQIREFCLRNGVRKLALFGSVISERFTDTSDIDVLVEFQRDQRVGFFRLADMEQELSRLLYGRKIDLRTPNDLSRYFREQVIRDAMVVYDGS